MDKSNDIVILDESSMMPDIIHEYSTLSKEKLRKEIEKIEIIFFVASHTTP